ncbi:hypothetical protein DB30_03279 [Enhygromyxa salina]|uniref:Uncharacterized protein n=1 Tax=Enhygromyxa salina TaxID=215803 RepID=A0A0C2CUJ0_9BACT|nr:hypothetical protein DB30_03279 [Enhygromyxa salina]
MMLNHCHVDLTDPRADLGLWKRCDTGRSNDDDFQMDSS